MTLIISDAAIIYDAPYYVTFAVLSPIRCHLDEKIFSKCFELLQVYLIPFKKSASLLLSSILSVMYMIMKNDLGNSFTNA